MATTRVWPIDIRPGTSAATNQRAAFLSPVHVYPVWSHSGDVSFSATRCTHVSTNMSLIRFPLKAADEASCNPPHGGKQCKKKGLGPVSTSAVLTAASVKHRWLYISFSTERHCVCQSGVWKLGVGKSVRCFTHLRTLLANVPWSTA